MKADKKIGENVTALGKGLYDETAARIGADAAQDKVIQQVNENLVQSVNTINKNVADGFTALNTADANEAKARTDADAAEKAAREAGDTTLDTRITKVKEYLENQTSENYVSKTDAAVQDAGVVKADKKIGENVTALGKGLYDETAARIGADKAQDKVIEKVNQNMVDGFNTINTNMANGFAALNQADANEAKARADADAAEKAARIGVDKKLAEAVNSGISLSDDNVLQKNTTKVDDGGNVTTERVDVTEMILNKGKDNQITLSDKGVKVGLNSGVMDKDGFYAGGDTADKAKAALKADGSIKGAGGAFTVDADGKVTAASGKIGNVDITSAGAVSGVTDLTASGKVTAGTLTDGKAAISNGNIKTNGGFIQTGGGNINTQGGALRTNGGNINAGSGTITGNKLTDGVASLQNGNLTTTGDINAHDITATGAITGTSLNTQGGTISGGAITGTTITGTTGSFGSLTTTGNASVGGTLSSNGLTNTGNATTDTLTVNHNATVGGTLAVTGDITGKSLTVGTGAISGGQITGTGLDVGAGTIQTTGAVETGTLHATGNATVDGNAEIGGNLTVDKNLTVNGTFDSKTLSSKLDENNYTTITGGNVTSVNSKVSVDDGRTYTSTSNFNEKGRTDTAADGTTRNVSVMTAGGSDSTISSLANENQKSYITQNLKKILQGIKNGTNESIINQTETGIKSTATDGKNTASTNLSNNGFNTYATDGTNKTYTKQTAADIKNTAENGTISNTAKNLVNTATENMTNTVGKDLTTTVGGEMKTTVTGKVTEDYKSDLDTKVGGNQTTTVTGDSSLTAKNINNKATKALTNEAETITNKASESVTTQIGDGTAVKSEMTADGITNTAEGGTIYNKSKDILNEVSGDILSFADGEIGNSATKITNLTGDNTVTSDTNGTTFENKAHSTAVKEGTITKTTISGNTITTGKAVMDYADVMKDLGVRGNAAVDGNTTLGKEGEETTLTVNSTSTFKKDVTMKSNATVEKKLTVNGQSTFNDKVTITNGGLAVTGGTQTDTLHVTGASNFDGMATFKDIVKMEKDLSVGGNATVTGDVTARSYKVGDKTYIDANGINANGQKITNVAAGTEDSDAANYGQLRKVETRVDGVENRVTNVENRVDKMDSRIDKVGANAAAMANLHPLEFDEDSKWNVAAAVGNYKGETATAVGAFYRPNEDVMFNLSTTFGNDENMVGGGLSLRLGKGGNREKDKKLKAAIVENNDLRAKVDDLTARMDALLSVINPNMSKEFPDVPENHWAYEAVTRLAGNDIVQGYEDGKFHGERTMTRYEMAELIYNALSRGAKAEKKLVEEFKPELQAMVAQKQAK